MLMLPRSKLSLEKDEFNFAFMLAHDLQIFATLDCIDLTPYQRLDIINICNKLNFFCVASSNDMAEIENLLGQSKAARLIKNTLSKARLETDLVNS